MIIAISGTPGTGKTAVAKRVAKETGFEYASLNELAEKMNLYEGFDRERNAKIVSTERISEAVKKRRKDNIVIESHYAQDVYSDLLIILTCELKELKKRLTEKGWPERKINENMEAEIMEVCRQDAYEEGKKFFVVDNTGNIEETVKVIKDIIKKNSR